MALTPVVQFDVRVPGAGFDHSAFAAAIRRRLDRYERQAERVDEEDNVPRGKGVRGRVEFTDLADADDFADWLAVRLGQVNGPSGRVRVHRCPHAKGEVATVPCTDPVTGYYERVG